LLNKTSVIILHRHAYSDSSWIVKAFSPESGVLSILIKGGKRKESPFKGALDPLAHSEIVFNATVRSELHFIREASLLHWFPEMRSHLESLAIAQVMAELLLRFAPHGMALEKEFELLLNAFVALDTENPPADILARWFYDLCEAGGYSISLERCVRCNTPLSEPAADFLPSEGGCVCKNCLGPHSAHFDTTFMNQLWLLKLRKVIPDPCQLETVFFLYLKNHLGVNRELHSISWLKEVRNYAHTTRNKTEKNQ